jgi:iron(III) transport system permease protein
LSKRVQVATAKNKLSSLASWSPDPQFCGFLTIGAVLIYLVVPPLCLLIMTSFEPGYLEEGGLTLDHYRDILKTGATLPLLGNTLIFSAGSSLLGLILGMPLAWIVERTNTPFRGLVYIAAWVSFATPLVAKGIAWIMLLGPEAGIINQSLVRFFQLEAAPFNVFSMSGMIFVEGIMWAPLVFLLMAAPLRSMDPALEEASTLSGAGALTTAYRITMRLALPSILSVLLLAFVRSLEAFEVPALIGLPAKVLLPITKIYIVLTTASTPDYGAASAYAVILLLLVGVALYLYARATRLAYKFTTITGKAFRPRVLDIGRWRYVALIYIAILPTLIVLPLVVLMWASFLPFFMQPSWKALARLTLSNYSTVFTTTAALASVKNSVVASMISATLAVLLTVIVVWLIVRTKIRGRRVLDGLVSFPLIFPGLVLGLAMLRTSFVLPLPIYGTIWIIIIAYIVRYLPYAIRFSYPSILQIHVELEESARICGAGWLNILRRILLPLMIPPLLAAWIWIFLQSIKELSTAVLLAGPKTKLVSVVIFDLWQNAQLVELSAFVSAFSALLIVISFLVQRFTSRLGMHV